MELGGGDPVAACGNHPVTSDVSRALCARSALRSVHGMHGELRAPRVAAPVPTVGEPAVADREVLLVGAADERAQEGAQADGEGDGVGGER